MMKKKFNNVIARALCCTCLFTVSSFSQAAPAEWKPEFLAPPQGVYGPAEALRIRLPVLPASVIERLVFELDDFDITAFVTREGADAVFIPLQPLSYGTHQLRLVEHAPDGSIVERGTWAFEVRKTASFREAGLRAAATLNVVRRVADDGLPVTAPGSNQANGGAQFQGTLADANWRATGQTDLLYNSQDALMPRGAGHGQVDMGRFLLAAEAGPIVAQAGHHSVGPDSLVMQGFNRRGVSVGARSQETGTAATVFSLRTQDVVGFQDGVGVGDSGNRTDGIVLTGRPVASRRDAPALSAMYVSGEGPTQAGAIGTGIAGDKTSTSGRAAGVVADGNLLERRLRLRGEYATTQYDFDGKGRDTDLNGTIDSNLDPERDRGYATLLTYTPWQYKIVDDLPMALNFGVENKRLGTFFKSPANPAGLSDRNATRGFAGWNWGGLNIQGSLGRESDNVNDNSLLSRTETTQGVLVLGYMPQLSLAPPTDPSKPPEMPWYGQPMFNMTYLDLDQDVTKAGAGRALGALHATRNLSATASLYYPSGTWSLMHSVGQDDDFTNLADDTRSRMTQLNANLRVGEKFSFGPMLQRNEIANRSNSTKDSETTTTALNLGYAFSQRVNGTLGFAANHQEIKDNSFNTRSHDIFGGLHWQVVPAQGAQPGFTLSLEGQYRDVEDRVTTNNQNNYQIFLKASVSWLPVY